MTVHNRAFSIHQRLMAEQAEAKERQLKDAADLARSSTQAALHSSSAQGKPPGESDDAS